MAKPKKETKKDVGITNPRTGSDTTRKGPYTTCPYCKKQVRRDIGKCGWCGTKIPKPK